MIFESLPDITGTSTAQPVTVYSGAQSASNIPMCAKWVMFYADPANVNVARLGGPSTSSTRGLPISKTGTMFTPPVSELQEFYDMSRMFVYVATGDKIYVLYGG